MSKRVSKTFSRSLTVNSKLAQRLLDVDPRSASLGDELATLIGESFSENLRLGLSLANDILVPTSAPSAKTVRSKNRKQ